MAIALHTNGYQENFIDRHLSVPLPTISDSQSDEIAYLKNSDGFEIPYLNFSIVQNGKRKFPFFSAANIDGYLFHKIGRSTLFRAERGDVWKKDSRIATDQQFGYELYSADNSDFDRGHMTKREDVQWGEDIEIARQAAKLTFYYTNSVPQHKKLNRSIWRKIEDYVLHDETLKNNLKINLFTGPVLSDQDPIFVTPVNNERVQIPTLFWKVIYFTKLDGKLYRVGFLVGQEKLLAKNRIIEQEMKTEEKTRAGGSFTDFSDGDTFQVNVSLIEDLTGLSFPAAIQPYQDDRKKKLLLEQVEVTRGGGEKRCFQAD